MEPETEKIIKEQLEKLPSEIREIFTDPGLNDKIINIGKKNGLNIDQLGTLQTETYLVMLGLVHPDEYLNELKNHLIVNEFKATNITNDVNKEILSGILEKLKETYKKTDEVLDNSDAENFSKAQETSEAANTQALNKAGINIVPSTPTPALNNEKVAESREDMLKNIEKPELIETKKIELPVKEETHPLLAQKLSSSFQIPAVKTQYSLDNITKTSMLAGPGGPNPVNDKPKIPSIDPYREIPE